jgi:hypothetical protein
MKQVMGALVFIAAVFMLLSSAASMSPATLATHIAGDVVSDVVSMVQSVEEQSR